MAFARFAGTFAVLMAAWPGAATAADFEAKEICACVVTGLSADGSAAVGVLGAEADYPEPFLWTAGKGLQRLGRRPLRAPYDSRPAISANGRVVAATILAEAGTHAVQGRWREDQGWEELGPLPADAAVHEEAASTVMGMSPDGSVVVGTYGRSTATGTTDSAAHWDAASGVVDLGSGSFASRVHGASRGGRVLVGVAAEPLSLYDRAVVWNALGKGQWLGPRKPSRAVAVSSDGRVIAGAELDDRTGEYGAMLWRREGGRWDAQMLGAPVDWHGPSLATGVSDDGRTVVGWGDHSSWWGCFTCWRGWVWTPETGILPARDFFRGVRLGVDPALRLDSVEAVSRDGQVFAVTARRNDGVEPSTLGFLVRRAGAVNR